MLVIMNVRCIRRRDSDANAIAEEYAAYAGSLAGL